LLITMLNLIHCVTLWVSMNRLGLGAGNPMHRTIVTPEYKYP